MLANSGTPLMWFGFFYLTLANVLLGVFEGAAIAGAGRVSFVRSVLAMLAANFVSSWAGAMLVGVVSHADITIANLGAWFWMCVVVLFALTVLVELPFVRWALAPRGITWRRALRTTLCVHAITYPLLFAWGWWWCDWTSFAEWTVVPVARLAQPGTHVAFYVEPRSGRVWRRDLALNDDVEAAQLPVTYRVAELFLEPEAGDRTSLRVSGYGEAPTTLRAGLTGLVAAMPVPSVDRPGSDAPSLVAQSAWRFQVGYGYSVLVCEGPGRTRFLSVATPLAEWMVHSATHIADDLALITLGDQICLVKASTAEIALVARGRGATVAAVRR